MATHVALFSHPSCVLFPWHQQYSPESLCISNILLIRELVAHGTSAFILSWYNFYVV